MRHHAKFEGDLRDATLDTILDFALSAVFPFLNERNARGLAEAVAEHIATHLVTELEIVNGRSKEEGPSAPAVVRLRPAGLQGDDMNLIADLASRGVSFDRTMTTSRAFAENLILQKDLERLLQLYDYHAKIGEEVRTLEVEVSLALAAGIPVEPGDLSAEVTTGIWPTFTGFVARVREAAHWSVLLRVWTRS